MPPTPPTTTNSPEIPLPPLNTLVHPEQLLQLFRPNEPRAAHWHRIFTQLWHSALHPHPENPNKQQRAHKVLASLSLIAKKAREKQLAAARQAKRDAAALQQTPTRASTTQSQQHAQRTPDTAVHTGPRAVGATASGATDFVHLDSLPLARRRCTMCNKGYSVPDVVDSEVAFRHYPVRLCCSHLVCFGCAKVIVRMHVNCASCDGASLSFGDGRAEMARIERQILLCGEEMRKVEAALGGGGGGVGAGDGNGEVRGSEDSDGTVSDGVDDDDDGDGGEVRREDVRGALALLNLAGRTFGMQDVEAGLALLDLKAGMDTTLEDYLLAILRR